MRPVRGVPAATPRRRVPRPVVALLVVLLGTLAVLGSIAARQTGPGERLAAVPAGEAPGGTAPIHAGGGEQAATQADAPAAGRHTHAAQRASRSAVPVAAPEGGSAGSVLAEVDGLRLSLPHPQPTLVAFHEASLSEALALTPAGRLEHSAHPAYEEDAAGDGPVYHVLASRGRPRPPTSSVDVVVPRGASVVAPVSGTVVQARQYALYGSIRDWRVVIEAQDRPDLHVVMIHLHQPAVAPGDEVVAGRSPIGVARQLPLMSQVDEVVGETLPHVHLEVKAATAARPIDPNKPAVELEEAFGTSSG
jgi:hypothetical protein